MGGFSDATVLGQAAKTKEGKKVAGATVASALLKSGVGDATVAGALAPALSKNSILGKVTKKKKKPNRPSSSLSGESLLR
jgi:hypothetical protein